MKKQLLLLALAVSTGLAFPVMADYDRETIQNVQQALNDAGFDCGTPDGVAGNNTKDAISEYQHEKGLTVTGEIDADLLASLFPAEEPEETEEVLEETEVATEKEEVETEEAKSATGVSTTSEGKFEMAPGDAMYFKLGNGVNVKLHFEGDTFVFEEVDEDGEIVQELVDPYNLDFFTKDFADYIAEKYFYAAKAKEEGLETRELNVNFQDLRVEAVKEYIISYHWYLDGRLKYEFEDGTLYELASDNVKHNTLYVQKVTEERKDVILMFDDNASIEETETFINDSFIQFGAIIYRDLFSYMM